MHDSQLLVQRNSRNTDRNMNEIATMAQQEIDTNNLPSLPSSLHYRNPAGPNEYMQAIYATGNVLAPYDADGQFPVFGFGAKLPNGGVSHDFNVNFNENDVRNLFALLVCDIAFV